MARATLRDDPWVPSAIAPARAASLDADDPAVEWEDADPELLVTVAVRRRTGYDADGNPTFGWEPVIEDAQAVTWTERTEVDETAGVSRLVGRATVLYDGDDVTEAAAVTTSDGRRWRVLRAERSADDVLKVELARIESTDA